jgi:hypothetical protein
MARMGRLAGATTSSDGFTHLQGRRDDAAGSTWTLISVSGGSGLKVWHQHGEGVPPVPLRAESVSSGTTPGFMGRAYVCPVCDDTTVVSRPDA